MGDRPKIVITLPEPEPDPPDGICDLCGGKVYGWWITDAIPVTLCVGCETSAMFKQRRVNAHGLGERLPYNLFRLFIAAFTILWHLEKEIARQKRQPA